MDTIRFKDINFSSLQKLQYQGTKSTIYRDGDVCFKILDGLYEDEKADLYRKFVDMDGLYIDNVLLPRKLIIQDGKLLGYSMDYFQDSLSLTDTFMTRYVDCKKLFCYVSKASEILRAIHQSGIICQDLSFENILVNRDGNVAFCDMDGCCFKIHTGPFISLLMKDFWVDYRNDDICVSENFDRISMLISFYYLIYYQELQNLSKWQCQFLSKKITTLENLMSYANMLVDKKNRIGEIPYLDELINTSDNYIIDRSLVKKLIK